MKEVNDAKRIFSFVSRFLSDIFNTSKFFYTYVLGNSEEQFYCPSITNAHTYKESIKCR
jgi:hypothetical protein